VHTRFQDVFGVARQALEALASALGQKTHTPSVLDDPHLTRCALHLREGLNRKSTVIKSG